MKPQTVRLGDVATIERSGVQPSSLPPTTPYVGLEHIDRERGVQVSETIDSAAIKSTKFEFNPSHILYGKLRPYLSKIAIPSVSGVCSTDILPIRVGSKIESRYLLHFLRTPDQVALATQRSSGANLPRLSPGKLSEFSIPLPPFHEQKRIARILDAADALRAKRRKSIAQLDALVQSTFLEMFGDPVTNPMGWPVGVVGDMFESVRYGSSKKASETAGAHIMLRMNNITYSGGVNLDNLKYVDLNEKEKEKFEVRSGDILFNRTNSRELVGKTAVFRESIPVVFAGYLVRGRVNSCADPEYIGAFMNTASTKMFLKSKCKNIVGMANINAKEFQSIPIPKPPIELQRRFAAIVRTVEEQRVRSKDHLFELDTLFASLQSRAFAGEL